MILFLPPRRRTSDRPLAPIHAVAALRKLVNIMELNLTTNDFKKWLKQCGPYLGNRTPDEIASLAHYVGFSYEVILPILSHFEDALRGSNFDNRAKMHIDHETIGIELISGKYALDGQWEALGKKLVEGKDFDD